MTTHRVEPEIDPRDHLIRILKETIKSQAKELSRAKYGVWQYLVDHSTFNEAGRRVIKLSVQHEYQFWQRVKAREEGTYKVVQLEQEKELGVYLSAKKQEKGFVSRIDVVSFGISRGKNPIKKLILFIYKKSLAYLLKL